MSRKRYGLGRGLGALIPGSDEGSDSGVRLVPIDAIRPNPHQPRQTLDEAALDELAASIREHGILQPLIVTQGPEPGQYTLIAGERRWRAAQRAGLERVPVLVREVTPQQQLELALIENVQRADLNPLEEAEAYRQLHEVFGLSHEDIAQRVGKSRVAVTNTLRLLQAAPEVRAALLEGRIREGHARALLALPPAQQVEALRQVEQHQLSVRQTEALVRRMKQGAPSPARARAARAADALLQEIEQRLERHLGTKVRVHAGRRGGRIVLYYYSDEELDALLQRLLHDAPSREGRRDL